MPQSKLEKVLSRGKSSLYTVSLVSWHTQKKKSTKQFLCHLKFFFYYQQAVVPTPFNLFSTRSRCATDEANSLYVFHTLTSMCATDVFKVLVLQKRCHNFLLPSQPRLPPIAAELFCKITLSSTGN